MKILFVIPYVPNLVRTRSYNLLRHLAARGNEVTLLTVWTNEEEQEQAMALKALCHDVQGIAMPLWRSLFNSVLALPGNKPLQSVYSWRKELVSHLNGNSPFDVIHVEHLRGSRYGLALKEQTRLPVVWDSVDCISHLFKQAAAQSKSTIGKLRSQFELGRTTWYEGWLLRQFSHVLVTSPLDKEALRNLSTGTAKEAAPISVLGNGVDIDYFSPDPAIEPDPATLVISGKMSYHANVTMTLHLANEIMPHIWRERPQVKLLVVGKDPAREIQALAQDKRIIVTGTVDHLPPYIQKAAVALSPITYGAGIQNKVLEAMACGTPVVTTPQAVSAIEVTPDEHIIVADTPRAIAKATVALLDSPAKREQIGKNGRKFVKTHHHWPNVAAKLESIYQDSIANLNRSRA